MLTLGLLTILGITQSIPVIKDCGIEKTCEIDGDPSTVVIVDKTVEKVVIKCINENSCKFANEDEPGLKVFSSANETIVQCLAESSCEGVEVNLGITPEGYLAADFESTRDLAEIICFGKQACKSMVINQNGELLSQLTVMTPDSDLSNPDTAAFLDGRINCGAASCYIACGTAQDSCYGAKCFPADKCFCIGDGICPAGLSSPGTSAPVPPPSPTLAPIPEPPTVEVPRTTLDCTDSVDCIPYDDHDVNCPDTITNCNVKCIEENQCQNGVIINIDSANANIECNGKNACDKVIVNVQGESIVTVRCSDEKVCSNAVINVINENAYVNVIINGKEAFFYGQLFCNGKCNLDCKGEKACFSTIYECTNTRNKCSAVGFENDIDNFGDSSCELNAQQCEPTVNGNTRIVAPKDVNNLIIGCGDDKECKKEGGGLVIYSSATSVSVDCGEDACEEVVMYCGELYGEYIPKGFKEEDFGPKEICTTDDFGEVTCVPQKMTVNVNCPKDGSCKGIKLVGIGNIDVVIKGDGISSLQNGDLVCDDCNKLDMRCRDDNGCTNARVLKSGLGLYNCVDVDGDEDGITESTCPVAGVLIKSGSSVGNNGGIGSGIVNENKTKYVLVLGIGLMGMFGCFIFGWLKNKNKKYNSINGDGNKSMIKNENIYATYQIELH